MVDISLIIFLIIIGLYCYWLWKKLTHNHDFFKKKGLKYKTPVPLFGNSNYFKLYSGKKGYELIQEDYQRFPSEKLIGLFEFSKPLYLVRSPELIKQITIKDFEYFQDHRSYSDSNSNNSNSNDSNDLFKSVLFSMRGKQWRDMRSSLSPLFTGSKMRNMLQLINNCSQQLVDFIKEVHIKNGSTAYDIKDIFSKYTNDVIASCVFGVECDSLRNPQNEIYLIGRKVTTFQTPSATLKMFINLAFPRLGRFLGLDLFDPKMKQRFYDLIIYTMDVRKREGIVRPDMIELLMKLRDGHLSTRKFENEMDNGSEVKQSWTDDELIAQCFMFFLAGFDSVSTIMMYIAYELAINQDIQDRLIDEIDKVAKELNGNALTYEALRELKYLDMIISETIRKWPGALFIDRECVKNYSYEDENGLKFTIEKGNVVWIPTYGLHKDPKYFPNPEKFDPERFNDENKSTINLGAYLAFGIGPRNCIGMRFALMELKSLFYYLLLNFKIKPSETTQVPLKLKKYVMALIPEKKISLYIEPRNSD